MRRRTALATLLLLGTAPAAGWAQTPAPPAPGAAAASTVTEFEVNGLKVLVKRRESSQTIVAGLYIRGGTNNITAENAGIEALMLDAAAEASAAFPRDAMRRELARTGASVGYATGYDYSVLTMATPRPHLDAAWRVFADVAMHPTFASDDLERIRARQVAAVAGREDSPESYVSVLQERTSFAGHPYANNPRGTPASLARLTLDDVKQHHQRVLATSRLLLVVVGNVEPQAIRQHVQSTFASLPRGTYTAVPTPQFAFQAPAVNVVARDLQTTYVEGLFAAPPPASPDVYAMRVAVRLLQDALFTEIRTRRNLSYAPNAFLASRAAGLGGVSASTTDVNRTAAIMLDEISRLQREDVSPATLRGLAQSFLTSSFVEQETNSSQAGSLAESELVGGGWRESERLLERIRAVTPADVRRVSARYMRNLQFTVLGDTANVDRQIFTRALP